MVTGETNSFQSLSLSPIILTIGYLVLIPASLMYKEKDSLLGIWKIYMLPMS